MKKMSVECNHDFKDKDNSLFKMPKRIMVHPEVINCYCTVCHKSFKFIKNDKGEYIEA